MDPSRLAPGTNTMPVADHQDRARRIKDAKDMYATIVKNAERSETAVPPYEFLELIGKGAYGRVYKCLDKKKGSLVAIKITEIDETDWQMSRELHHQNVPHDENIREFRKEVSVLQRLKDMGIPNVNVLHDAFDMHSQLWMVSDYCTGGSVRTLMRPYQVDGEPRGLPEQYIIPIAREVAVALAACHEAGIIHRDIKCANIYITEEGKIQVGDFGIVGVLEHETDKRRTVIGTPHWMPQELAKQITQGIDQDEAGYRFEVDIWSYGCTLYEMATGHPPNQTAHHEMLHEVILRDPPRLTDESYSAELRDLIAECLEVDPSRRVTAQEILQHPAIADTSERYPTSSLVRLIERFMMWERGGGSRQSLWIGPPSGQETPSFDSEVDHRKSTDASFDGWIFSTSEDYERRLSKQPVLNDDRDLHNFPAPHGSGMPPQLGKPQQPPDLPPLKTKMTIAERIKLEHSEKSASRGEKSLARIYDPSNAAGYDATSATPTYEPPPREPEPSTDLPLRTFTDDAPTRESMLFIDLDDADKPTATSTFALHMDNQDTLRPIGRRFEDDDGDNEYDDQQSPYPSRNSIGNKRDTVAWTFDWATTTAADDSQSEAEPSDAPQQTSVAGRSGFDSDIQPQPDISNTARFRPGPLNAPGSSFTSSFAPTASNEPPSPDEPYISMDLPEPGAAGELAPAFRPSLKHTRTEPIGHFRDFSHDMGSSAASPMQTSLSSLDMGLASAYDGLHDPAEIARPSTASSTAGSTMTDMTSGNPFDLEEDPIQNELDRQRYSHHKQWQSEGGRTQPFGRRSVQMHARGSSLSSTDDEFASNQRPGLAPNLMQHPPLDFGQGFGDLSPEDMDQWPNFSSFQGVDTSPQYYPHSHDVPRLGEPEFPLDHGLRSAANGMPSRSREASIEPPTGPAVSFPPIHPPHPDALLEHADPQLLSQEFTRALDNLVDGLETLSNGLCQYAGIGDDDGFGEMVSDAESGFDSNREGTEDEDGQEQLTYRRARPRHPEPRSSPRMPQSEGFQ